MKKNKLILMVMIAIVFCLTLDVKAIDITTDSTKRGTVDKNSYLVTNTGTLAVTNLPDPVTVRTEGKDLIAVKIIDVFYNSVSNEVTYEFTSDFQKFLSGNSTYKNLTVEDYFKLTSGDITSGSPITSSTLDQLVNKYYISDSTIYCKINSGECNFTNLPAGAYKVRPYNYFDRAFATMVGNIVPIASDNTWTIQGTTIVAKTAEPITFNAYIGKVGNKVGTFTKDSNLKLIFTVDYTNYPKNLNENADFRIWFGLSSGLFHIKSPQYPCDNSAFCATLKVMYGPEVLNIDAPIDDKDHTEIDVYNSSNERVGRFNFQVMLLTLNLNNLANKKITIEYTLTNKEQIERLGSDYRNFFSDTNEYGFFLDIDGGTVLNSSITLYSYDLKVLAHEKDNKSKTLSGITFDVYSDEAMTNKVDTITTGSDGTIISEYIGEGTFYLKQTKTSSGYTIVKPFSITINSTNTEPFGTYEVEVPIAKAGLLPVTGGIGTIIYTAIGLSVIIGAATVYTIYRKKNKVQELSN